MLPAGTPHTSTQAAAQRNTRCPDGSQLLQVYVGELADSHLAASTDVGGSAGVAGLQVSAKPWMPGARFACRPLAGP